MTGARFNPTRVTLGAVPRDAGRSREQASLQLFLREVARQCRFAKRARRAMDAAASRYVESGQTDSESRESVWYHAQAYLSALAVLSRLLTGADIRGQGPDVAAQKKAAIDRAAYLRAFLGVDEATSLVLDRWVRNQYEHVDERLDRLVDEGAPEIHQDSNIIPPGGVTTRIYADPAYTVEVHPLRLLDLEARMLIFQAGGVDLDGIEAELEQIAAKAAEGLARAPIASPKRIGVFGRVEKRVGRDGWEVIDQA